MVKLFPRLIPCIVTWAVCSVPPIMVISSLTPIAPEYPSEFFMAQATLILEPEGMESKVTVALAFEPATPAVAEDGMATVFFAT